MVTLLFLCWNICETIFFLLDRNFPDRKCFGVTAIWHNRWRGAPDPGRSNKTSAKPVLCHLTNVLPPLVHTLFTLNC